MSGNKDIYHNALKRGCERAEAEKLRKEEERSRVGMLPTPAQDPAKARGYISNIPSPNLSSTSSSSSSSSSSDSSMEATPPKRRPSPVKKMPSEASSSASRGNNNHYSREDISRIIGEPEEAPCLYVIHQASTNSNRCVLKSKSCIYLHFNFPRPFVMTLINFHHGIDDARELTDDDGNPDGNYLGLQF